MKRGFCCFLVFLFAILLGCGGSGTSSDEIVSASNTIDALGTKIANGITISDADVPQLVRLNITTQQGQANCSGAVISSSWILTAAHCVENYISVSVEVDGRSISTSQVLQADGYYFDSSQGAFNDVAVIQTSSSIGRPALPITRVGPSRGEEVVIIGFGLQEGGSGQFGTLRYGRMVIDSKDPQHINAYHQNGTSGICQGDSGGPLLYYVNSNFGPTWAIAGVNSTGSALGGQQCAAPSLNTFANTERYIDALRSIGANIVG